MQDPEIISSSRPRLMGAPPDTLYMLINQATIHTKLDGDNALEYDTSKLPGKISCLNQISKKDNIKTHPLKNDN